MNPMVPGLGQGGKMSASDPNSKIDLLEEPKIVKKKINSAFCSPGNVEENGLLSFVQYVVAPIQEIKHGSGHFEFFIDRPEKFGGPITFNSFEDLKQAFKEEKLSPPDLKTGVADAINVLLAPIREEFANNAEYKEAQEKGYPVAVPEKTKKAKKPKNKGSRYPGAAKQTEQVTEQLKEATLADEKK